MNDIKLHLGCGGLRLPNWLHIDRNQHGPPVQIRADGCALPLKDNCCSYVFHEHLLEHLEEEKGIKLLCECKRVLQPGGWLRVATPDLSGIITSMLLWWEKLESRPGGVHAHLLSYLTDHGHKRLYSCHGMERVLSAAGFRNLQRVLPGQSTIPELRNLEQHYVVGQSPPRWLVYEAQT